ncbi:MAG: class I SAM-dependent methyltransferase [Deltaproteobacteria bacterium]|nr:class I SAM-dependent methyltransferase [Deltaproteobacteria bacterium]
MIGIQLAELGVVPQPLLRFGIRRIVRDRLHAEQRRHTDREQALDRFVAAMADSPIALSPQAANAQHYEVPPAFFEAVLGPQLKYSSAFYPPGVSRLADAETAMLDLTMARAQLADGQRILELGCGWGSLTLAMAQRFPGADIVAVSNSRPQAEFIRLRATARGLSNVRVLTCDMNAFAPPPASGRFDRVVSVEMFEHMRNWAALLARISGWLTSEGRLFLHVFAHRSFAYSYELDGDDDWMARHFFTGGMMPSVDLPQRVASPLTTVQTWTLPGTHYARTAEAWHHNLLGHRAELLALFTRELGARPARRMFERWGIFFLACAELFGYAAGQEWVIAHHLLAPRRAGQP